MNPECQQRTVLILFRIANLALAYLICDVIHNERGLRSPVVHWGQAIESCSGYGKKYMCVARQKWNERNGEGYFLGQQYPRFQTSPLFGHSTQPFGSRTQLH